MSLTTDILDLRGIHLSLYNEWNNFQTYLTAGSGACQAESWASLKLVFDNLQAIAVNIRGLYMGDTPSMRNTTYAILHYIDENLNGAAPAYELTMEKLLDAMWGSDKLRSFHFINYIDAMRASIWNVEIYETHLAEWYRHFNF